MSTQKCCILFLGIIHQITKCQFVILVIVLRDVLGVINILSTTLQSKLATLGKAEIIVNSVIDSLENMRTDKSFSELWLKIVKFCDKNDISLEVSHPAQPSEFDSVLKLIGINKQVIKKKMF